MTIWLEGTVVENIHWTENIFTLQIDADVEPFQAGQFTSLALDLLVEKEGKKTVGRIARPYSYLNAPQVKPLEFFLYRALAGTLSNALAILQPGDKVWLKQKANGFFTLAEVPDAKDLWLIGTGTGIAPFLSILNASEVWQRFEKVILVQGVRSRTDLQYQELIAEFKASRSEQFCYQPFVSREDVAGTLRGRIPEAIADGRLEKAVNKKIQAAQSQVMLCGNPDMVKDALEVLKDKGLQKNLRRKPGHVTTENYW